MDPARRAAKVGERVKELSERRAALAAGQRPTRESVDLARHRAEESMHRAQAAHHAAAVRHEELARVHERTANTFQSAALHGVDDPAHLQEVADRHWEAAQESHLKSLEDQAKADDPGKSSSG
ncbi:hypothetical protein A9W95_18875 [Mycobacterium sp. 1423905.2]|nr:hypothetical protein A9W95_18875 [Mycobacterium sp. 1423905.2]